MHEIDRYTSTNVGGTATLLDAIVSARRRTSRFILASSRAVYGEGSYLCPNDGDVYPEARRLEDLRLGRFDLRCPVCGGSIESKPTAESAPLRPASVYAVTKQTQEELVRVACTSAGVDWLTLRFQNVFGPDQSLSNPYTGILSIFSALLLAGSPVEIYEDGIESRDFVFVSDAVGALVRAIESSVSGLALNIGSGEATSVFQVATLLSAAFESPSPIEISGRFRVGDIRHNVADLVSAQRELGYRPRTTLADGIREFTRWVTSQPRRQSRYADSLAELERLGLSGSSEGKL
jgi:dTDP-L-rhamnose 4-epimerase